MNTRGHDPPPPTRPPDDDALILWVWLGVSLLGVIPKLVSGGPWGAQPTLALLFAIMSAAALIYRRFR